MHDLRRLRAFYEVAERGSFSAAALELGYAQSVLSHHVAALEAEHGITLIDRSSRPVRLTPAGERLRSHAVEVLGYVATAEDTLRSLAGVQSATLRLGAFSVACTTFVPRPWPASSTPQRRDQTRTNRAGRRSPARPGR